MHAGGSDFRLYDSSDLKDLSFDEMVGPDALAVCWAHRVYLLDFFCSGSSVLFTVESLFLLFSFFYLDLYVLGDDALIS